MNHNEFDHYIENIVKPEFSDREIKISRSMVHVREQLISMGQHRSTLYFERFANLFSKEFEERSNYILNVMKDSIPKIKVFDGSDPVTKGKVLYQNLANHEKIKLKKLYNEETLEIARQFTNFNTESYCRAYGENFFSYP